MGAMILAVLLLALALLLVLLVWHFRASHQPPPRPLDPAGMRSHVSFLGAERYMAPAEQVGEGGVAGRGILEQLAAGLQSRGLEPGEVVDEAWGALLEVGTGADQLQVCAGSRGDDWLIYVAHGSGGIVDTPLARRLLAAIDATLKSLAGIERVSWHRAEDWAVGREDAGAAEPLGR
jgi:hypothetical protein